MANDCLHFSLNDADSSQIQPDVDFEIEQKLTNVEELTGQTIEELNKPKNNTANGEHSFIPTIGDHTLASKPAIASLEERSEVDVEVHTDQCRLESPEPSGTVELRQNLHQDYVKNAPGGHEERSVTTESHKEQCDLDLSKEKPETTEGHKEQREHTSEAQEQPKEPASDLCTESAGVGFDEELKLAVCKEQCQTELPEQISELIEQDQRSQTEQNEPIAENCTKLSTEPVAGQSVETVSKLSPSDNSKYCDWSLINFEPSVQETLINDAVSYQHSAYLGHEKQDKDADGFSSDSDVGEGIFQKQANNTAGRSLMLRAEEFRDSNDSDNEPGTSTSKSRKSKGKGKAKNNWMLINVEPPMVDTFMPDGQQDADIDNLPGPSKTKTFTTIMKKPRSIIKHPHQEDWKFINVEESVNESYDPEGSDRDSPEDFPNDVYAGKEERSKELKKHVHFDPDSDCALFAYEDGYQNYEFCTKTACDIINKEIDVVSKGVLGMGMTSDFVSSASDMDIVGRVNSKKHKAPSKKGKSTKKLNIVINRNASANTDPDNRATGENDNPACNDGQSSFGAQTVISQSSSCQSGSGSAVDMGPWNGGYDSSSDLPMTSYKSHVAVEIEGHAHSHTEKMVAVFNNMHVDKAQHFSSGNPNKSDDKSESSSSIPCGLGERPAGDLQTPTNLRTKAKVSSKSNLSPRSEQADSSQKVEKILSPKVKRGSEQADSSQKVEKILSPKAKRGCTDSSARPQRVLQVVGASEENIGEFNKHSVKAILLVLQSMQTILVRMAKLAAEAAGADVATISQDLCKSRKKKPPYKFNCPRDREVMPDGIFAYSIAHQVVGQAVKKISELYPDCGGIQDADAEEGDEQKAEKKDSIPTVLALTAMKDALKDLEGPSGSKLGTSKAVGTSDSLTNLAGNSDASEFDKDNKRGSEFIYIALSIVDELLDNVMIISMRSNEPAVNRSVSEEETQNKNDPLADLKAMSFALVAKTMREAVSALMKEKARASGNETVEDADDPKLASPCSFSQSENTHPRDDQSVAYFMESISDEVHCLISRLFQHLQTCDLREELNAILSESQANVSRSGEQQTFPLIQRKEEKCVQTEVVLTDSVMQTVSFPCVEETAILAVSQSAEIQNSSHLLCSRSMQTVTKQNESTQGTVPSSSGFSACRRGKHYAGTNFFHYRGAAETLQQEIQEGIDRDERCPSNESTKCIHASSKKSTCSTAFALSDQLSDQKLSSVDSRVSSAGSSQSYPQSHSSQETFEYSTPSTLLGMRVSDEQRENPVFGAPTLFGNFGRFARSSDLMFIPPGRVQMVGGNHPEHVQQADVNRPSCSRPQGQAHPSRTNAPQKVSTSISVTNPNSDGKRQTVSTDTGFGLAHHQQRTTKSKNNRSVSEPELDFYKRTQVLECPKVRKQLFQGIDVRSSEWMLIGNDSHSYSTTSNDESSELEDEFTVEFGEGVTSEEAELMMGLMFPQPQERLCHALFQDGQTTQVQPGTNICCSQEDKEVDLYRDTSSYMRSIDLRSQESTPLPQLACDPDESLTAIGMHLPPYIVRSGRDNPSPNTAIHGPVYDELSPLCKRQDSACNCLSIGSCACKERSSECKSSSSIPCGLTERPAGDLQNMVFQPISSGHPAEPEPMETPTPTNGHLSPTVQVICIHATDGSDTANPCPLCTPKKRPESSGQSHTPNHSTSYGVYGQASSARPNCSISYSVCGQAPASSQVPNHSISYSACGQASSHSALLGSDISSRKQDGRSRHERELRNSCKSQNCSTSPDRESEGKSEPHADDEASSNGQAADTFVDIEISQPSYYELCPCGQINCQIGNGKQYTQRICTNHKESCGQEVEESRSCGQSAHCHASSCSSHSHCHNAPVGIHPCHPFHGDIRPCHHCSRETGLQSCCELAGHVPVMNTNTALSDHSYTLKATCGDHQLLHRVSSAADMGCTRSCAHLRQTPVIHNCGSPSCPSVQHIFSDHVTHSCVPRCLSTSIDPCGRQTPLIQNCGSPSCPSVQHIFSDHVNASCVPRCLSTSIDPCGIHAPNRHFCSCLHNKQSADTRYPCRDCRMMHAGYACSSAHTMCSDHLGIACLLGRSSPGVCCRAGCSCSNVLDDSVDESVPIHTAHSCAGSARYDGLDVDGFADIRGKRRSQFLTKKFQQLRSSASRGSNKQKEHMPVKREDDIQTHSEGLQSVASEKEATPVYINKDMPDIIGDDHYITFCPDAVKLSSSVVDAAIKAVESLLETQNTHLNRNESIRLARRVASSNVDGRNLSVRSTIGNAHLTDQNQVWKPMEAGSAVDSVRKSMETGSQVDPFDTEDKRQKPLSSLSELDDNSCKAFLMCFSEKDSRAIYIRPVTSFGAQNDIQHKDVACQVSTGNLCEENTFAPANSDISEVSVARSIASVSEFFCDGEDLEVEDIEEKYQSKKPTNTPVDSKKKKSRRTLSSPNRISILEEVCEISHSACETCNKKVSPGTEVDDALKSLVPQYLSERNNHRCAMSDSDISQESQQHMKMRTQTSKVVHSAHLVQCNAFAEKRLPETKSCQNTDQNLFLCGEKKQQHGVHSHHTSECTSSATVVDKIKDHKENGNCQKQVQNTLQNCLEDSADVQSHPDDGSQNSKPDETMGDIPAITGSFACLHPSSSTVSISRDPTRVTSSMSGPDLRSLKSFLTAQDRNFSPCGGFGRSWQSSDSTVSTRQSHSDELLCLERALSDSKDSWASLQMLNLTSRATRMVLEHHMAALHQILKNMEVTDFTLSAQTSPYPSISMHDSQQQTSSDKDALAVCSQDEKDLSDPRNNHLLSQFSKDGNTPAGTSDDFNYCPATESQEATKLFCAFPPPNIIPSAHQRLPSVSVSDMHLESASSDTTLSQEMATVFGSSFESSIQKTSSNVSTEQQESYKSCASDIACSDQPAPVTSSSFLSACSHQDEFWIKACSSEELIRLVNQRLDGLKTTLQHYSQEVSKGCSENTNTNNRITEACTIILPPSFHSYGTDCLLNLWGTSALQRSDPVLTGANQMHVDILGYPKLDKFSEVAEKHHKGTNTGPEHTASINFSASFSSVQQSSRGTSANAKTRPDLRNFSDNCETNVLTACKGVTTDHKPKAELKDFSATYVASSVEVAKRGMNTTKTLEAGKVNFSESFSNDFGKLVNKGVSTVEGPAVELLHFSDVFKAHTTKTVSRGVATIESSRTDLAHFSNNCSCVVTQERKATIQSPNGNAIRENAESQDSDSVVAAEEIVVEILSEQERHLESLVIAQHNQLLAQYKAEIRQLKRSLRQEKELHQITRTSMENLERDHSDFRNRISRIRRENRDKIPDRQNNVTSSAAP